MDIVSYNNDDPKGSLNLLVTSLLLFAIVSVFLRQSPAYGETKPSVPVATMIEANNAALMKAWSYGWPDKAQVKALVAAHDFVALEKWYGSLLEYYKKEVQYEQYLFWAFEIFDPANGISPPDLDAWVAKTGSTISYVARGIYRCKAGYAARGSKYASETSKEQFAAMQRLHDEAAKDLQKAIAKDPTLMPAYASMIRIAKMSDMPFTTRQVLDSALMHDRRTFEVRSAYMGSLLPRWGGSYEAMSEFAAESIKDVTRNPRLTTLQGDADADRADLLYNKDAQAAIDGYTKALRFGDRITWLTYRGDCYKRLGDTAKAEENYARIRMYDTRTNNVVPARRRLDLSKLRYDLKDNTYIDPNLGSLGIRTYAVAPVEHHVPWLTARADEGSMVMARNGDKIQDMIKLLGCACVKRSELAALLKEQNMPLSDLSYAGAQTLGKRAHADAVILSTVLGMGVDYTNSQVFVNLDIKAVSVKSGKIIWKSLMNGRVDAEYGTYKYQEVLDAIETSLYNLLTTRIAPEPSRQKVNR